jgi:hypothetical protein
MIIRHYEDVQPIEMMKGVRKRVVIGEKEGAPNFIMRIFDLDPGASSPITNILGARDFCLRGGRLWRETATVLNRCGRGDTLFIPHA